MRFVEAFQSAPLEVRGTAAFAYALFLLGYALAFPSSKFLAAPFTTLFYVMLKPLVSVLLGADGTSIFVVSQGVFLDVTDVCSGMLLIGLVAVFLWVRGVKWIQAALVLAGFFTLNLFRVAVVALIVADAGLQAAVRIHEFAYATFTLLAVATIAYSAYPTLRALTVQSRPRP